MPARHTARNIFRQTKIPGRKRAQWDRQLRSASIPRKISERAVKLERLQPTTKPSLKEFGCSETMGRQRSMYILSKDTTGGWMLCRQVSCKSSSVFSKNATSTGEVQLKR